MEALLVLAGADRALHDRLSAALVRAGCRIAALADLDRLAQPARGSGSARVVLVAGGGGEAERAFLSRLMAERPELPVVRVAAADAGGAGPEGRRGDGRGMEGGDDGPLSQSVMRHLRRYFDRHEGELPPAGLHQRILREVEMPLIEIALAATGGNQARCAELLGINRNTLRKKIAELDIRVTRRRKLM